MSQLRIMFIWILLSGCALVFACHSAQQQAPFATEEKQNATFGVKITAFREQRSFGQALAGAQYVFEAKKRNQPEWKQFMVYNYDDPIPIDKNSISFVNDAVGYVVIVNQFAVTTDGGSEWSVWDVSKAEQLKDDRSCRIQGVSILPDGKGTMDIKCNHSANVLSTVDFGVSWK